MKYNVTVRHCINDFGEKEITGIRITDSSSRTVFESGVRPLYPTEIQKYTPENGFPYFYEIAASLILILQGEDARCNDRVLIEKALKNTAFHAEAEGIWWID